MVLESQESKVRYQGNGMATEWPVPFPVLREEHLHLIVTDANGKDTLINSNYEITGIREETVSVTYPMEGEPLSSAHSLTIYRELPLVQQLDLENGGNFNAEVVERQLDNTVMQIQQIQEQIDRSIKVSISSEEIPKTAEDIYEQVNLIADRAKGAVIQAENAVNSAQEQAELATSAANDAYSSNCTAKAWAALAYGEPVEFDLETDEALFSARHYRDEASEIAMGNIPNASPAERGLVPHTENGKAGWVYQITENGEDYEFAPLDAQEQATRIATPLLNGLAPSGGVPGEYYAVNDDGTAYEFRPLPALDTIPKGLIAMWSGTVGDIPSGWLLCDGSNGTPNLTDRFIVGAGGTYQPNSMGGTSSHTHTINVGNTTLTATQMPMHSHSIQSYGYDTGSASGVRSWTGKSTSVYSTNTTGGSGAHTHPGSAGATTNLPPYYALCFIMKSQENINEQ